eukprot:6194332-Pleurochrysis_carterae.AAC.2
MSSSTSTQKKHALPIFQAKCTLFLRSSHLSEEEAALRVGVLDEERNEGAKRPAQIVGLHAKRGREHALVRREPDFGNHRVRYDHDGRGAADEQAREQRLQSGGKRGLGPNEAGHEWHSGGHGRENKEDWRVLSKGQIREERRGSEGGREYGRAVGGGNRQLKGRGASGRK